MTRIISDQELIDEEDEKDEENPKIGDENDKPKLSDQPSKPERHD